MDSEGGMGWEDLGPEGRNVKEDDEAAGKASLFVNSHHYPGVLTPRITPAGLPFFLFSAKL